MPRVTGAGGPAVFQRKLAAGLRARGVDVTFDTEEKPFRAVLVIGGTRDLAGLLRLKRLNIPIVQRLDGLNWIHRRRRTGLRHYLKAELGNFNLNLIRRWLSDRIVYQSEFARQWWEAGRGAVPAPDRVIYNGVDLETFSPHGPPAPPDDRRRVLLVEGNLAGGYDIGLEHAVELVARMNHLSSPPVELMVAGNVSESIRSRLTTAADFPIHWAGHLPQRDIPDLDRSAHLLFSADLNAACPNSVIEAMACGLPVLSLETGALPELVRGDSGIIVPYGGDPWALDPPDFDGLAKAGMEILGDQDRFRTGARARALERFDVETMVNEYMEVFE